MRPTLRLENPIDTSRILAARRSWASFPGAGGFGWLLAVLGCLAAPGSGAAVEPLLEGRVLLSSGAPAGGARVRLFAELGRSLGATADESGYFAFPLKALRRAAPLPARLHLGQNYPNPFNPSTIIPYQLPAPTRVRLEVFNILGQRVATLVDGERPAGFHTAAWNATDASGRGVGSGVYLYRLLGGGERLTRSMVLLDGPGVPGGGGGSGGAVTAADPWRASTAGPAAAGGAVGAASGSGSASGSAGAGSESTTDPSGRTAGAAGPEAWIPANGEGQLYGLTVWGPGMVPYVDPAFRVGRGPVEIRVQPLSSLPRGKALAGGGLLGDVNRDGRVDLADALLIASYSEDPALSLGNGDLTLGDIDGDGQVDLADARLIEAYHADPSDPSLPEGIGAPSGGRYPGADALLDGRGQRPHSAVPPRRLRSGGRRSTAAWSIRAAWPWTKPPASSTGPTTAATRSSAPTSTAPRLKTWSPTGLQHPPGSGPGCGSVASSTGPTTAPTGSSASNLDGSQVEDSGDRPADAVEPGAGYRRRASSTGPTAAPTRSSASNLDGSEIEDLVTTGLDLPRGLALDAAGGKLYWSGQRHRP